MEIAGLISSTSHQAWAQPEISDKSSACNLRIGWISKESPRSGCPLTIGRSLSQRKLFCNHSWTWKPGELLSSSAMFLAASWRYKMIVFTTARNGGRRKAWDRSDSCEMDIWGWVKTFHAENRFVPDLRMITVWPRSLEPDYGQSYHHTHISGDRTEWLYAAVQQHKLLGSCFFWFGAWEKHYVGLAGTALYFWTCICKPAAIPRWDSPAMSRCWVHGLMMSDVCILDLSRSTTLHHGQGSVTRFPEPGGGHFAVRLQGAILPAMLAAQSPREKSSETYGNRWKPWEKHGKTFLTPGVRLYCGTVYLVDCVV